MESSVEIISRSTTAAAHGWVYAAKRGHGARLGKCVTASNNWLGSTHINHFWQNWREG